ncbi:hypothetical protein [Campylobacter showae]|uniref:Uncharacterized protein n=1 Tax=Campylobacter showae CC57C TaxID=1073353 RepID=M3IN57_9BACT|nr:hypothetical protein [Campylobacter showae]EMG31586.1 hypothetical protein H740_00607 [Campylobacter showae CC57C]
MKRYKNANNEIYAYDDDVSDEFLKKDIEELGLTPLTQKELDELNKEYEPSPEELEIDELNEAIKEVEDDIRRAILIGNDSVLPELREEYKELLAQKQSLEKGDEK